MAPWLLLAALAAQGNGVREDRTGPGAPVAPPGFRVEIVYEAAPDEGSWICMTREDRGRILVSGENGPPLRLTLGDKVSVEKLDVPVRHAEGMLFAHGNLYLNGKGPEGSGLYLERDGKTRLVRKYPGGGDHGQHGIVAGPDGRVYVLNGNFTGLPDGLSPGSPHRLWQEDLLLPRLWDANGHARGVLAPGGYVARMDPEGKEWTLLAAGFRNPYDLALHEDGEFFTYDADMEWDLGAPWYRPTRVVHVVSGGEYGWRSGTGKWPASYPDSLPPAHDVGLGSPTGLAFGYGSAFPPRYRRALFMGDWTYGRILAVHLTPRGASYAATHEVFLVGRPLNVTDLDFGPDGAMYFITGGWGARSRLYRVTYAGPAESERPVPRDEEAAGARALRRRLEAFHGRRTPEALEEAWPHLDHPDRFIRWAARVAVEPQDPALWTDRALSEIRPRAAVQALLALARTGVKDLLPRILETLAARLAKADAEERLDLWRVHQVAFARMGPPPEALSAGVTRQLEAFFPAPTEAENRELSQLLVYLQSPEAVPRTLVLMAAAPTQEEQMHYALALRVARRGWTEEGRRAYFSWFVRAAGYKGGQSFHGFLRNIRADAEAALSEAERAALAPLLAQAAAPPRPRPAAPASFVRAWTLEELLPALAGLGPKRPPERGRAAFAKAQCLACHRFDGEGGVAGPDLSSVGGRFAGRDLLETILLPSKAINETYRNTVYRRSDGEVVVGRVIREDAKAVYVQTDPLQVDVKRIPREQVAATRDSEVSPMPEGLLNVLTRDEILDLLAWLESGGGAR